MPEEIRKEKVVKLNYPGNSHKAKEAAAKPENEPEERKVEKVISGDVVQRRKPLGRKIAETFVGDNMHNVGEYVLFEVLLPAAKSMVVDAGKEAIERMIFGDSSGGRISSSRSSGAKQYTSYNRMSNGINREDRPSSPRTMSYKARASHDFKEIVLANRGEAERVLEELGMVVEEYDVATVSDLYDLVGITGSFTDDKWGWADLRGAQIRRVRDGYLLDIPRPSPID
jgi:hypothetical protein